MIDYTKRVLTSVKVVENTYQDFKIVTEQSRLTLGDLVERSMYLYITDPDYRLKIHSTYNTYYTGSVIIEELKRHQ
jgi:hypothetical protein